jgi:peptidoglycan/xylan/chitin deacetylase (PgdA/CDA1 family)
MRVWALPVVLLALAGCVSHATPLDEPGHPVLPAVLPPPVPAARDVDCGLLKCVALTFDDGPGPYTARLLDLLRQRAVRATFFVVGEMVDRHGETVRRIAADGHELGNHSWSHLALTGLPRRAVERQLTHTGHLVRRLTGVRMRVMRPPYGSTDARVAAETRREGLAQILWNVDTFDWRDHRPAKVAARAAHARPGSIVLMHDIHRSTVEAVPAVLDRLAAKGFTFVTVSELYGKGPVPGRTYGAR